jgi:hypothetical protein
MVLPKEVAWWSMTTLRERRQDRPARPVNHLQTGGQPACLGNGG